MGAPTQNKGAPANRVNVRLQVGSVNKTFDVLGRRFWIERDFSSGPENFLKQPITYDVAYGGTDTRREDVDTYLENPVGIGYYPLSSGSSLAGKALAQTQAKGQNAKSAFGGCRPMSLGALGRNFAERARYAGTYDADWLRKRVPYWPDDFDYHYFQAAPADQQMPYPVGGETVTLTNLSRHGTQRVVLPDLGLPILLVPHRGNDVAKASCSGYPCYRAGERATDDNLAR